MSMSMSMSMSSSSLLLLLLLLLLFMLRYLFWLRLLHSFVVSCDVSLLASVVVSCVVVSSWEFWIVVAGSRYPLWLQCRNMFFFARGFVFFDFAYLSPNIGSFWAPKPPPKRLPKPPKTKQGSLFPPPENAKFQLFLSTATPIAATLAVQDASRTCFC